MGEASSCRKKLSLDLESPSGQYNPASLYLTPQMNTATAVSGIEVMVDATQGVVP